ncbi:MAG: thiamine-phosphate kinase [Actinobacteria bacterium]|nr:thiamine-phosphate kinase [Actinomycetota bacterium]MBU1942962.1 thiamine-phosphate kinase [Actinomycetota bacterium]MBU2687294.1 thiamine-phosphate kinase [Actinomycetota bacterium]
MAAEGLSEGEIIALIRAMAGDAHPGVEVPIGDDAASFHFAGGSVLLSIDSVFEDVHFTLRDYGLCDVGWKAVAAAVSDIAAMGGQPSCLLVSAGFAKPPTEAEVRSLMDGILEMAASCNCALVGGDVSRASRGLSLAVAVAGTPPPSGPVLRSGAGEGDAIGVTGMPGRSAAGLRVIRSGEEMRSRYPGLVEAHLRPRPQVAAGTLLAAEGVSAMEDISDGLARDLVHICEESGLGCELEAESVPLDDEMMVLAAETGADPLQWALAGGEDYGLVFTVAAERLPGILGALARAGVPASGVGRMTDAGTEPVLLRDGARYDLGEYGYDHFR